MGFLLDANVLIAMAWPAHTAHDRALEWFATNSSAGWATCPWTEIAFVRVLSNPAFSPDALTPREALTLLQTNLEHPSHRFLPDDIGLLKATQATQKRVLSHRQVADAYLLGLAQHHQLKLATLDKRILSLLPEAQVIIELIP